VTQGPRLIAAVACGALLAVTSPVAAGVGDPRLSTVETFALAIGDSQDTPQTRDRLARHDLVVIDGETAPSALIDHLRDRGVIVLGYLSVGTIEPGRSWYPRLKPFRLDHWSDWDEWFARVSSARFRDLITDDIAPDVIARGFDGLFLDNVDMIEGHPKQRDGMEALVRALADLVHERGGLLFAQNGEDVIEPLLSVLDGWNREDVSTAYDFNRERYGRQNPRDVKRAQRALRHLADAGLFVTTTDYVASGDHDGERRALRSACEAGAVPYVSDIELQRLPPSPWEC
jgi:polysaccharide biosynthesis protein PelA